MRNAPLSRLNADPSRSLRKGFSLTELLVVLVIIGILSSLMLAGLTVARDSARAGKTASTIRKLNEVLMPHYEEYEVRRPSLPSLPSPSRALNAELRRIAIRRLMALELPESAADLREIRELARSGAAVSDYAGFRIASGSPVAGVTISEMPPACRRYGRVIATAGSAGVDSAELLYMIVMRGPVADSDVVAHFRPDEIGDLDDDGLPEFLDAWRRPIRFRRWPVGLDSPVQPASGSPDLLITERGYPLIPLIYSAGPDGTYDLEARLPPPPADGYASENYEPFFTMPAPQVLSAVGKDDITNHDLIR